MYKLDLEKGEEPEIKLPTCGGLYKTQRISKKNIYFCFIDYAKAFGCVDHNKLWSILKEMGILDHITCFLRNLYSSSLSWWCYLTISSSAALFFCFQSFPASGSFPISRLFASGGQSIGVSALASVLPVNIQGWFPLELTGLISLQSKGL